MRQVTTFSSKVTDEYGGEYPEAIIAIHAVSETSQTTHEAENCQGDFKTESLVEAITYQANYWYANQTKQLGKRSRPLVIDKNGEFSSVFTVDLNSADIVSILNSDGAHEDKIFLAVKADLMRRFK